MLLKAGSETNIGSKCALILAVRRGDLESARLISLEKPDDELARDGKGLTPVEIAAGLKDPSFELLLISTHKPTASIGEKFVESIKNSILQDMAEERQTFEKDPSTIDNLADFLDSVAVTEHSLWRFGELINLQSAEVKQRLTILNERNRNISPVEKSLNELQTMWEAKIKETASKQNALQNCVFTPESRAALQRWEQVTRERKAFFEELMAKSRSLRGDTGNALEELEFYNKMNSVLSKLKNWEIEQIRPFQSEIVTFTRKVQLTLAPQAKEPGMADVFGTLKMLNTQINETNPSLFEVKSTTSTRKSNASKSVKSSKR